MPSKGYKYSEEHAKNHLAAVRIATSDPKYKKNMSRTKKGVAQPIESRVGATEKHHRAKEWWFIKSGYHYKFRSLNKFVRDNKHLFTDEELTEYKTEKRAAPIYRATVMLRNLHLLKKDGTPVISNHEWNGWTIGEKWEDKK